MEPPFDDDDLGPCSRSRSNTWPRLARAPPPQPDALLAPCYPEHDMVAAGPGVRPGGGGMDVILEDVVDDPAAPTSAKAAAKPRNAWGNASYADLIAEAITTAPERRLTLAQIYRWMEEHVPYFRSCSSAGSSGGGGGSSAGWKNSVRHNLSLLDRFVRVQNEDKGQSSWWTVDPDAKPGRGSRTRRRAASMEASKTNEQRRSRVLERVKSLRRAKQQPQPQGAAAAADAGPAGPAVPGLPTCPADQLAGSLRQYMALGEDARAAYLAQSLASASNPGDSTTAGGGPGSGPRCPRQPQARYRSGMAAAAVPENCYGGRAYHSAPMYAHQAVGQGRSAPPAQPPSPPLYQQLPTILQSASDASSGPCELPTVLPRRQAPSYASPPAYRPPPRAPADDYPPYQPTADPPAPVYHDEYQPVYQPLQSAAPPSSSYQYQPQYGQPYEPQPACDDLGLPFTVDGGLNCDVEAVLRQELILEGNLDFNFSQPQSQPSLSYGTAYVSHSLVI